MGQTAFRSAHCSLATFLLFNLRRKLGSSGNGDEERPEPSLALEDSEPEELERAGPGGAARVAARRVRPGELELLQLERRSCLRFLRLLWRRRLWGSAGAAAGAAGDPRLLAEDTARRRRRRCSVSTGAEAVRAAGGALVADVAAAAAAWSWLGRLGMAAASRRARCRLAGAEAPARTQNGECGGFLAKGATCNDREGAEAATTSETPAVRNKPAIN